jgi:protein-S-isoprenylcysteine O-methyltransferase Ste14
VSDLQTRPATFPWPPIAYASALALAIVLSFLLPMPWLTGTIAEFLFAVGILLLIGGVALIGFSIRALSRAGTTVSPMQPATQLVTSGPFGISRNPIYLGNTVVMVAIALIAGSVWFIVMGIAAALATSLLAIRPEERHLELRFGRRYRDYAKRVRRWI